MPMSDNNISRLHIFENVRMGVSIFLNATNSTIYHKAFPVILGNYNGICVSYIKYLYWIYRNELIRIEWAHLQHGWQCSNAYQKKIDLQIYLSNIIGPL